MITTHKKHKKQPKLLVQGILTFIPEISNRIELKCVIKIANYCHCSAITL